MSTPIADQRAVAAAIAATKGDATLALAIALGRIAELEARLAPPPIPPLRTPNGLELCANGCNQTLTPDERPVGVCEGCGGVR